MFPTTPSNTGGNDINSSQISGGRGGGRGGGGMGAPQVRQMPQSNVSQRSAPQSNPSIVSVDEVCKIFICLQFSLTVN
jgi:hypothetical protein